MRQGENETRERPPLLKFDRGQQLEVTDLAGDPVVLERLREIGLRPGAQVRFLQRAPFGGPYLFQLPSTLLALRREELECLNLKLL
jgi:Fe2+ transport system protein FeoA